MAKQKITKEQFLSEEPMSSEKSRKINRKLRDLERKNKRKLKKAGIIW